jgi:speckle-type POZ protein
MMHIVWSLECRFLACGRNSRVLVAAGHPIPCRKFVKKSILEDPARGLLLNDTIIIRYQIELVVSTGGALARQITNERPSKSVVVPPPNLGAHMLRLFEDRLHTDVVFEVESNQLAAHKIILSARSPVFKALLTGPMLEGASFISSSSLLSKRAPIPMDLPLAHLIHIATRSRRSITGQQDMVVIKDIKAPVFKILLHFAYADDLPEEIQGTKLDVPLAQHLLAAADRFQLLRLRCICEARLCDSVSVETAATTLALAEQNNAKELKRVCLDFVSKHLAAVMNTEAYDFMVKSCPSLQAELLGVIACTPPTTSHYRSRSHVQRQAGLRNDNDSSGGDLIHHRRVRPRRE